MRQLRWLGGLAAMALLLARPQAAVRGAALAMAHWQASVAPSLFPFLALMPLLTCREAAAAYEALLAWPMKALFNLPGAAAPGLIVGMAAGTPAGALAARSVAARAGMSRGQLFRLAVAAAGFSPAFLVSGIGVGMLNNAALGWKLLGAQLLTQVTLALLLRRCWAGQSEPVPPVEERAEVQPIRAAVLGILGICGYMMLFGSLAGAIGSLIGPGPANVLLCLLDVPSGARWVASLPLDDAVRLPLLAMMCGFGGMCVIAQSLGALRGCGLEAGIYAGLRAAAGLLSAGYMALLQGLPALRGLGQGLPMDGKSMAAGALVAALMSIPILKKLRESDT